MKHDRARDENMSANWVSRSEKINMSSRLNQPAGLTRVDWFRLARGAKTPGSLHDQRQ